MDPIGVRERPLADVLARLRAPVPPALVDQTRKPGGTVSTINVWTAHDLLDFRAPGWTASTTVVPTPRGDLELVVGITIVGSDGELTRTSVANGDPGDTDDPKQPGDAATNGWAAAFKRTAASLGLGRELWLKGRPRGWVVDWDTPVAYPGGAKKAPAAPGPRTPPAGNWSKDLDAVVPDLEVLDPDTVIEFRSMFDMSSGDPEVQATIAAGAERAVAVAKALSGESPDPAPAEDAAPAAEDFGPAPWDADAPGPADLDPPGPLGNAAPAMDLPAPKATRKPPSPSKVPAGSKSSTWEPRLSALTTPAEVAAWRGELAAWAATAEPRHADQVWAIYWKNMSRVLGLAIAEARTVDELAELARQVDDVPAAAGRQELKAQGKAAWDALTTAPA